MSMTGCSCRKASDIAKQMRTAFRDCEIDDDEVLLGINHGLFSVIPGYNWSFLTKTHVSQASKGYNRFELPSDFKKILNVAVENPATGKSINLTGNYIDAGKFFGMNPVNTTCVGTPGCFSIDGNCELILDKLLPDNMNLSVRYNATVNEITSLDDEICLPPMLFRILVMYAESYIHQRNDDWDQSYIVENRAYEAIVKLSRDDATSRPMPSRNHSWDRRGY